MLQLGKIWHQTYFFSGKSPYFTRTLPPSPFANLTGSCTYHPSNPLGQGGAFEHSIGGGLQDGQEDEEQSGQLEGDDEGVWKVCGKLVREEDDQVVKEVDE